MTSPADVTAWSRGWFSLAIAVFFCSMARAAEPQTTASGQATSSDEIEDYEQLDLENLLDVVFSAAKHEQDIAESPSAISVISREDIEASGASTIVDLLRMVPGMDVVLTSPYYNGVSSRMKASNEYLDFLVLIDGREANSDLLGFPPYELQPISLQDIERIEVLRGPGSALYGTSAMAGVISITTRAIPKKTSLWSFLSAGEIGMLQAAGRASSQLGNWGFSVNGGVNRSGMFYDSRTLAKQVWNIRAVGEYRWSDTQWLMLDGGIASGSGRIPASAGTLDANTQVRTLRLAYESDAIRAHLYWSQMPLRGLIDSNLSYRGIVLADFVPIDVDSHAIHGALQWTLPRFWQPLLLITGVEGRVSTLTSDQLLDADTYPANHRAGVNYLEGRAAGFLHGEIKPIDWLTLTAGLRLDWNSTTDWFLSPRLATVFRLTPHHFLRLGVGRAFRKPSFIETRLHPMVEFPPDSPFKGAAEQSFQDFMTRVLGNLDLNNEELLSFEAGYIGRIWDDRLTVTLDLFFNRYLNEISVINEIVPGFGGLPDLASSSVQAHNSDNATDIMGVEFSARLKLSRSLSLLAFWTHREAFEGPSNRSFDNVPKNLFGLGGRFQTEHGLLGSLYLFTRSESTEHHLNNPTGILDPNLTAHKDNTALLLGKFGWKVKASSEVFLEFGAKMFLPVSLTVPLRFRSREMAGGIDSQGINFCGDELRQMVSLYLEGSY